MASSKSNSDFIKSLSKAFGAGVRSAPRSGFGDSVDLTKGNQVASSYQALAQAGLPGPLIAILRAASARGSNSLLDHARANDEVSAALSNAQLWGNGDVGGMGSMAARGRAARSGGGRSGGSGGASGLDSVRAIGGVVDERRQLDEDLRRQRLVGELQNRLELQRQKDRLSMFRDLMGNLPNGGTETETQVQDYYGTYSDKPRPVKTVTTKNNVVDILRSLI